MLSGNIYLGMSPKLTTGSSQSNSFGGVSQPVQTMDVLEHWFDAQSGKVLNFGTQTIYSFWKVLVFLFERRPFGSYGFYGSYGPHSCCGLCGSSGSYGSFFCVFSVVLVVPMVPTVSVVSVVPMVCMVPMVAVFPVVPVCAVWLRRFSWVLWF